MRKIKMQVPHTYVIVFLFIVIAAVATWFVPGGKYIDHIEIIDGVEQTTKVFEYVESKPQTWEIFGAMFTGFENQAGIIVFILMIGGAFWIMNESRALDVGIFSFLRITRRMEKFKPIRLLGVDNMVITLIMIMFSLFGAIFGMSEETIAFIIIFVPLSISMGFDSIVGVSMCFVAAGLGFAGAILNPFTIGIAQGLSGLPLFSGFEYRIFSWFALNIAGIGYVLWYANKIKKNPTKSIVYADDEYWRKKGEADVEELKYYTPMAAWIVYIFLFIGMLVFAYMHPTSTLKIGNTVKTMSILPFMAILFGLMGFFSLRKSAHFFVLTLLTFTIFFLIIGVMGYNWYIMEIASLFFGMGLFSGIAMNKSANNLAKLFSEGAKDIMSAALVVGLAGGIIVILKQGQIIDTILHGLSNSMNEVGQLGSVSIMYGIQNLINIVIPSGSAKAALTMPIMAPFSDLIGLSRQATVMAFQFGDGFTNMITPTSPVLIGVLGVAKISYSKWVKWIAPLMVILIILGWLLLIPTVTMKLNGF
jgi:uncharacterized ion transporter superfamily protein YfcC